MAPRAYEQRARAESAADTRRRILDAVYARLREAPAQPVSIDRIARTAGVARSTVYLIFGSRAGLFDALGQDLYERSGLDRLTEAVFQPDARASLRDGVRRTVEMYAPHRDVIRALHSMAQLDEEAVGGSIRRREQTRARGMARIGRELAEQGALQDGVTAEDAAHVVWVLTSFESFDLLYTGRGLPVDEVARLLVDSAERTLLR
jgi:AcrR family transcriptional regulator